jgi:hypothetical protein
MYSPPEIVRAVASELGNHPPVWFPSPIYEDVSLMPVSPSLLEELGRWNEIGLEVRPSHNMAAITEHYRIGRDLARRLATELGPGYQVLMLMAGDNAGWQVIDPNPPQQ